MRTVFSTQAAPRNGSRLSAKSGYRKICADCRKKYDNNRYESHRERIKAQHRGYHASTPGTRCAADHRARSLKYGLKLTTDRMTHEDLVATWGNRCAHCGEGLFEVIDHVIPVAAGGPHTLRNVVPCCRACNGKKRWTFDRWIIHDHREVWEQTLPTGGTERSLESTAQGKHRKRRVSSAASGSCCDCG